jgi:RND family efflux transporter MFP subunit
MRILLLALLTLFVSACDEAGDMDGAATVRPGIRVTLEVPRQRDIDYVLTALGSVESMQRPTISAETAGQVITLDISEGDAVESGQVLLEMDNTLHASEASKAEAELKRADALLENQTKEVSRLKRLEKSQSVSRDQLEDEEAQLTMLQAQRDVTQGQWDQARHHESKTRVLAPQAGRIARRHVSRGDYVVPGQPLVDLVAVETLRARLAFPEHDAARIRLGQEVQLSSPAAPDSLALGEITSINPLINVLNRSMEVMVEFNNPGGWYPGASVDATLVVERHTSALTIPRLSVVKRNVGDVVFVAKGEQVREQKVTLGWRETDWVEVVAGLGTDERVVVQGSALLSDGSKIVAASATGKTSDQ